MEVRNPILCLPSFQALASLPDESQEAIRAVLYDLAIDANARAEKCWRKSKGPMAAYWKAVSVYAKHIRAAIAKARGRQL
jgi:hypothetical protein